MNIWSESTSLDYIRKHELWDEFEAHGVDFCFPLSLFEMDGKIVGGVQGQLVNHVFCIGYFFVVEKGKGYGRKFVELLKEYYGDLEGHSLPSSVLFWKKTGMKFPFIQTESQEFLFYHQAGA